MEDCKLIFVDNAVKTSNHTTHIFFVLHEFHVPDYE